MNSVFSEEIIQKYSHKFSVEGINIYTNNAQLKAYLKLNLEPYYFVDEIEKKEQSWNLIAIDGDYMEYVPQGIEFERQSFNSPSNHTTKKLYLYQDKEYNFYLSKEEKFILIEEKSSKNLLLVSDEKRMLKNTKTILRDQILYHKEILDGSVILHGAAVRNEMIGVLILGDKKSGKTSTMIHFLNNDFDFISNDLVVFKNQSNISQIKGMPESICIGLGTINNHEKLKRFFKYEAAENFDQELLYRSDEKKEIEWFEISDLFGVKVISQFANVNFVIIPEINISLEKPIIRVEKNSKELSQILERNIMIKENINNNFWLSALSSQLSVNTNFNYIEERFLSLKFIHFEYSGNAHDFDMLLNAIKEF